MKYKGIIFDLDGVLCQTDEYHYQAWKQLADRLQIPFDREQNNSLRGVSRTLFLQMVFASTRKQRKRCLQQRKMICIVNSLPG